MAAAEKKPRLLIAEDDPAVQSVLAAQLGSEFQIVAAAADAAGAIALAARHEPDVAIIDVQMPHGGGLRAAREIRSRVPETALVALASDEARRGVLDMLDAGAECYVRKGVAAEELVTTLHRAMAAHAVEIARKGGGARGGGGVVASARASALDTQRDLLALAERSLERAEKVQGNVREQILAHARWALDGVRHFGSGPGELAGRSARLGEWLRRLERETH